MSRDDQKDMEPDAGTIDFYRHEWPTADDRFVYPTPPGQSYGVMQTERRFSDTPFPMPSDPAWLRGQRFLDAAPAPLTPEEQADLDLVFSWFKP